MRYLADTHRVGPTCLVLSMLFLVLCREKMVLELAVIMCRGGILPFGTIFIEMYLVFASLRAEICHARGFLTWCWSSAHRGFCVAFVCTYFLLNAERCEGWGHVSYLLRRLQSTLTCTPCATIFSKQRCMAYFKHHFTLVIWRYLAQPWG